jgi:hypothetical protein
MVCTRNAVTLSATLCLFSTHSVESLCLYFSCLSFSLQGDCLSLISLSCLSVFVRGIGDGPLSLSLSLLFVLLALSKLTLGESLGEYDCWTSFLACNLLGERVARQVTGRVAGRFSPCVEPHSDNALVELLGEPVLSELLGEICWESSSASKLLRERVALQIVPGRVAHSFEPPSDKALGESLPESLLGELLGR